MKDCFIKRGSCIPTMFVQSWGLDAYVINRGKYVEFNMADDYTKAELLTRAVELLGCDKLKEHGSGWDSHTKVPTYFPPHRLA